MGEQGRQGPQDRGCRTTMGSGALAAFALAAAVATSVVATPSASAFCGFYVSGADASLYNDATMVVMMREGTKTVLSMQNNYQGPPSAFAMIVPVPVVLQEENVKTLPREIFAKVDQLAAPRLVEYWEQDPCYVPPEPEYLEEAMAMPSSADMEGGAPAGRHGVTIEAQFTVGEYEIVILSAEDSTGLDTWLREEEYNIPEGAEPVLRPYVEQGTKFFVAKVDPEKVTFEGGRAVLSPLRFHYDAEQFALPVRLGLLNSQGKQDLIVHVLARGQRYEVANYQNATIPTNIRVQNEVREKFGAFYDALFEKTIDGRPRTVVTEYAWDAGTCDPCPGPTLDPNDLTTLGVDVLPGDVWGFVLTRLHYRYGSDGLDEDLVFRAAPPIVGGRGTPDQQGEMQEQSAAQAGGANNFQGRYVILHWWDGPLQCDEPVRGRWGGPPAAAGPREPMAAPNLRLQGQAPPAAPELAALVAEDVSAIGLVARNQTPSTPPPAGGGATTSARRESGGCGSCMVGSPRAGSSSAGSSSAGSSSAGSPLVLTAFGVFLAWRVRRRF